MNPRSDSPSRSDALRDVRGTILLVGAGKMGSALLEGWLALGIAPNRLAVIEPQPSGNITALASQGLNLNPPPHPDHEVAAVVIAVKPHAAPQVMPTLVPFVWAANAVWAAGLRPLLPEAQARATVAGSGELLHRSRLDAATLRQNVTSPGGTTAAALDVLMARDGLQELMTKAIAAAAKRSHELAG